MKTEDVRIGQQVIKGSVDTFVIKGLPEKQRVRSITNGSINDSDSDRFLPADDATCHDEATKAVRLTLVTIVSWARNFAPTLTDAELMRIAIDVVAAEKRS